MLVVVLVLKTPESQSDYRVAHLESFGFLLLH